MNVIEIAKEYAKQAGAEGFCGPDCGCSLEDFPCCGGEGCGGCELAVFVKCEDCPHRGDELNCPYIGEDEEGCFVTMPDATQGAREEDSMEKKVIYSCGYCGIPMDAEKNALYVTDDGYDPDQYPHDICCDCRQFEEALKRGEA